MGKRRRGGIRGFGRGFVKGLRGTASVLAKTGRAAKTLLGTVDKMSGGAATAALASHPYGQGALLAMEASEAAGQYGV